MQEPEPDTPRTLVFGEDWIPLGSRATDSQDCKCLVCTGELIEIKPAFAVEVVRLLVTSFRALIKSCSNLCELCQENADDQTEFERKDSSEMDSPFVDELDLSIAEFENNIKKINLACDAILPWMVWYSSPTQRATPEEPIAMRSLFGAMESAEYLHKNLQICGDGITGGDFWRSAPGVAKICQMRVDQLVKALKDDERINSTLAGWDDSRFHKLRLTRLEPPESWHFCSEECCCKFERELIEDTDFGVDKLAGNPSPDASGAPTVQLPQLTQKKRQRLVEAFWQSADWTTLLASADDIVSHIWPEESRTDMEELKATRLKSLVSRTNDSLRERGDRMSFHIQGDNLKLALWGGVAD